LSIYSDLQDPRLPLLTESVSLLIIAEVRLSLPLLEAVPLMCKVTIIICQLAFHFAIVGLVISQLIIVVQCPGVGGYQLQSSPTCIEPLRPPESLLPVVTTEHTIIVAVADRDMAAAL
jgi:hypothetical protein